MASEKEWAKVERNSCLDRKAMTTPSAGAMRAANYLASVYFIEGSGDGHRFTADKSEIAKAIDRETGAGELADILYRMQLKAEEIIACVAYEHKVTGATAAILYRLKEEARDALAKYNRK